MAKLEITEEERRSASYLDWDDASLGRAVKKLSMIFNEDGGRGVCKFTSAAVFLISEATSQGFRACDIEVRGAYEGDRQLGDWSVKIEQIPPSCPLGFVDEIVSIDREVRKEVVVRNE